VEGRTEPRRGGGHRRLFQKPMELSQLRLPRRPSHDLWRSWPRKLTVGLTVLGNTGRLGFALQIGLVAALIMQPRASTAGEPEQGRRIYFGACVACHGSDGAGAMPEVPDLTEANSPLTKPDAALTAQYHRGNGRKSVVSFDAAEGRRTGTDGRRRPARASVHASGVRPEMIQQ